MSQADELLENLVSEQSTLYTSISEEKGHIIIGEDRFITVPPELRKIAVEHDHDVNTVTFDCPRFWSGRDLSSMNIYINYRRPDGETNAYPATNLTVDDSDNSIIHFDWTITKYASYIKGSLAFLVCAKKTDREGMEMNHWNSELNTELYVSEGMEADVATEEPTLDTITQILTRLDTLEKREVVATVSKDSIEAALGYIPPEYDPILYDKYEGSFIHLSGTQEGMAKLVKPSSELLNHTVTSCGKNLFNINGDVNTNLSTGAERPGYITVENGVLSTTLFTSGYHPNGQRLHNLKGKTVSFSAMSISEDVYGYIGIYEDGIEELFTTGNGLIKLEGYVCKTDNPIFGFNTAGSVGGAQFTNIQIEIGETATDYEPYVSDVVTVTSEEDIYSLSLYDGQTNIFNDCASSMTIMVNQTIDKMMSDSKTYVKRSESVISDANYHTITGYAKTQYGVTQNLPEQVYGSSQGFSSERGVLFFIAENVLYRTGTQIFYPIDGPYKGRIFVRSLTNMISGLPSPGEWSLLANEVEVNTAKAEANAYTDQNVSALLQYVQSIVRPYDITWTDGGYISKDDGSVNAEEGSSYSDFVEITPGTKLIISNTMTSDTEYNAFYDSTQSYLSSFSTDNGSVIDPPSGARYFRLSKYSAATVIILPEVVMKIVVDKISELKSDKIGYADISGTTITLYADDTKEKKIKTLEIPSVTDDHINTLIDAKLGVIENGTY